MAKGDEHEMVRVLQTTDAGLLAVMRSVLDAAGIPHVVQGEAGVSLFPLGEAGARVTRRLTGASLLVSRERAEEARALLETPPEPLEEGEG
jgi:hypothetical protein